MVYIISWLIYSGSFHEEVMRTEIGFKPFSMKRIIHRDNNTFFSHTEMRF
jgi:hypothetical protein